MVGLQAAALSLPSGQSYRRPQSATFQPLPALSWQHAEGVGPTQPQCPPSLIPHRAAGHDASQDLGVPGIWGAHLEARLASSLVLQATAWHGLDLLSPAQSQAAGGDMVLALTFGREQSLR